MRGLKLYLIPLIIILALSGGCSKKKKSGNSSSANSSSGASATSINHAPLLSHIENREVAVGEALELQIYASDPEEKPLTYGLQSQSLPGIHLDSLTGKMSATFGPPDIGVHEIVISVSDGEHERKTSFVLTVVDAPKEQGGVFITRWDTRYVLDGQSGDNQIQLPLVSSGVYDFVVDWGDGSTSEVTSATDADAFHTYASPGVYTITMTGRYSRLVFGNGPGRNKIIDVPQWGTNAWASMNSMFKDCLNIQGFSASDAPNMTDVKDMTMMFYGASNFNGNIGHWDTSSITNMSQVFQHATSFNQDISKWDTAKVTSFYHMFCGAHAFNQPLGEWKTSNVTNMWAMFADARKFNQNLNKWDTSKVSTMHFMFQDAHEFNGNISSWNTGNVTNMQATFARAFKFNQNIQNWNTSNVTNMREMFSPAKEFNQDLSGWDVSAVTNNYCFACGVSGSSWPLSSRPSFQ